jgi:hypothetical protein
MTARLKVSEHRVIRWGYYMDHLLDYFFLCSVIIGYAFILPERPATRFFPAGDFCGLRDEYLSRIWQATDRLKISYLKFGPTEFRLALIIINLLLVQYGTRYMISGLKYANIGALLGLALVIYRTHKLIWEIDMSEKGNPK